MIFDAHLDLAMNAMEWNRDLTQPIETLRAKEAGLTDKPDRGRGTVCFPEMRRGSIGLCVATQIARYVKPGNPLPGWHSPAQAWAQTQAQWSWYQAMEEVGALVRMHDASSLQKHLEFVKDQSAAIPGETPGNRGAGTRTRGPWPVGYVLSLEGADSLITLHHLERAYAQGLRAVGPAHYGPGTYAQGTDAQGGLGVKGRELLAEMDRLGLILDVTHLCDESFWEAVEHFQGPLWASHSNCRALVPHHRQLSDEQIRYLIGRGGVIGTALDAWMLVPGWVRAQSTPQAAGLTLERVVDHIDHVCQIAGNARHAGIGSDLDGGFGREQTPSDLETIADLSRLPSLLKLRGYAEEDIRLIMYGNFVAFLLKAWR
ncbi:MAG TPA: membrane dipeptidase [Verrucomicrobiae bacterium]|nr:membrane dipeptidase [Verrucomicrobiae bacterium]